MAIVVINVLRVDFHVCLFVLGLDETRRGEEKLRRASLCSVRERQKRDTVCAKEERKPLDAC